MNYSKGKIIKAGISILGNTCTNGTCIKETNGMSVHFLCISFFFFFCLFFSLASYILVLLICWLRRECIFENKLSNIIFFKGQCTVLGSTSSYRLKNFTESSFYGHFSKIPRKMHLADSYFRKVALLQLGKNSVTSVFFEILWEISEELFFRTLLKNRWF